jgi:ABC-type Zn uptake system ZnuABC Zn-binding protein ZnuA
MQIMVMLVLAFLASGARGAALRVVTTTTDLASIAQEVGGERLTVTSLQDGRRDPHFLQAKPSHILLARRADLWICVGMGLEVGYEPVIIDSSRNRRIRRGQPGYLDVSARVRRLDVPTRAVDRSMGDVHPEGNPHYWLDPWNGRVIAEEIAERLGVLDPAGEGEYRRGLAAFERRLDAAMFGEEAVERIGGERLWELQRGGGLEAAAQEAGVDLGGWWSLLAPARGAAVISHHRSWNYLLDRFGLVLAAELEPKPGIPPSSSHLADVVRIARARGVKAILVEPFYSRKAAEFVAQRAGATVVQVANATGGTPEAEDYASMLDAAIRGLAGALVGEEGKE